MICWAPPSRLVTHAETQLAKESGDVIHEVCKHGCLTISQLIHEVRAFRVRARAPGDGTGWLWHSPLHRPCTRRALSVCDLLRKP